MSAEWENRIVAFIDIQGFTAKVNEIGDDFQKFENIRRMLTLAKSLENKEKKKAFFDQIDFLPREKIEEISNSFECTVVSDSLIFSFKEDSLSLMFLTLELAALQWDYLWKRGYLLRGFVSSGLCYHRDGVIFGPAYLKAYEGAEKNDNHKMPYILLDDGLKEKLYNSKIDYEFLFTQDNLKRDFINYRDVNHVLGAYTSMQISVEKQVSMAKKFISEEFDNNKDCKKIADKYAWTYSYLNASVLFQDK